MPCSHCSLSSLVSTSPARLNAVSQVQQALRGTRRITIRTKTCSRCEVPVFLLGNFYFGAMKPIFLVFGSPSGGGGVRVCVGMVCYHYI